MRVGAMVLAVVVVAAGCSGSDDGDDAATSTTEREATTTSVEVVGDGSPFCDAMIALGQIGMGATAEDVLAANEELVGLLDEAQANTPADAPSDLDALIDDYRAASDAIAEHEGDLDAAYESLSPDVVARLSANDSHPEAYEFLVDRCGLTA